MWIPETPSFAKGSLGRFEKSKSLGSRVFAELPRVVAQASRGRDSSYFGLFSIFGVVWLSFHALRGCLAVFSLRGYFAN